MSHDRKDVKSESKSQSSTTNVVFKIFNSPGFAGGRCGALLPFLTFSDLAALKSIKKENPVNPETTKHLENSVLCEIKKIITYLRDSKFNDVKLSSEGNKKIEEILKNTDLTFSKRCEIIFSEIQQLMSHYFSRILLILRNDDLNHIGFNKTSLVNNQNFYLLNIFLRNKELIHFLSVMNQHSVERAGRFFNSPPIFDTVVQINTINKSNFLNQSSCTGFIIERNKQKYILTRAHDLEEAASIRIHLKNHPSQEFSAVPFHVSNQCDLAILEVKDPEFNHLVQPAVLGKLPPVNSFVKTVRINDTAPLTAEGRVSRIVFGKYLKSDLDMLQVELDTAPPWSSFGSIVFYDSQVIGLIFQRSQNNNHLFMIPSILIERFLSETFSGKKYMGFPDLPVSVESFYFHCKPQGLLLRNFTAMSDAFNKLKLGDVLLEIDSLPIRSDGTVYLKELDAHIDFRHIAHMKCVGDAVNLTIRRPDCYAKTYENIITSVTLDTVLSKKPWIEKEEPKLHSDKCYATSFSL